MNIDDFEWVEEGFDVHILVHKTREMTIAVVKHFNGWYIHVLKAPSGTEQITENIDNLEAAKVIAVIHVNQYMEGYPNVSTYRKRPSKDRPQAFPEGVFKLDKLRR
jgi:phosphoribosylformylglycinamidine (FGAM) synthase-like enzyme